MSDALHPPCNLVAEEYVIGAMMLAPSAVSAVRVILAPEDFFRASHGRIYATALQLSDAGCCVDAITMAAALEGETLLGDDVEERCERIRELATLVPVYSNAVHHARIVRDFSLRRAGLNELEPLIAGLRVGGVDATAALVIVERVRQCVVALGENRTA